MADLQIGRIGLETEKLDLIERARHVAGRGALPEYTFLGVIVIPTLDEAKYLRNQLLSQFDLYAGDVWSAVPIIWDADSTMDGYYRLLRTQVGTDKIHESAVKLTFNVTVERLGGFSQVMMQSMLSINDIVTDHGTDGKPWHSPPAEADAYSTGGAFPDLYTRDTEDGEIQVAVDLPQDVIDPTWSVAPENYYKGASRIHVDDRLIAGLDCEMLPTDWVMSNGLMQVRAAAFGGASNGEIECSWWDGAAWSDWFAFEVHWDGTNKIPAWNYFTVVDNRPEVCIVKLMRDAAEDSATTTIHTLELTLRRGAPFVSCRYHFDGDPYDHSVVATAGGSWTRPVGASYAYGPAVDGQTPVMGCPRNFTLSSAELQLDVNANSFPFWVGAAINGASSGSGHGPADLTEQYLGWTAEAVQAVRR